MLRSTPPDHDPLDGARALPVPMSAAGTPPGEDGLERGRSIELEAQRHASEPNGEDGIERPDGVDFLKLVRQAEDQALLYQAQVNRRSWSQSYRAFHQEHYIGSKYTRPDWRGRSKLFVPKTRTAVRKDMATVAASLFNNIDAITCMPGNDGDPKQRGAAAVMQELVNYRTDRASGSASFPWFLISMGARQDAVLTGVCCTKQSWKQEFRKTGEEQTFVDDGTGSDTMTSVSREKYALDVDRPEMQLIPPENIVIDPAALWTNPAQTAAFLIIKWPMQIEEIKAKQKAPLNPWNELPEETLKNSVESGKWDMAAIRRAREMGIDRLDETQTNTHFQVIWVYEVFIRAAGQDWTFYSVGDRNYLTDPKPTREVYPEQDGERPIAFGIGSLESHRIYPMSAAESWQPLQLETNDLRNLMLDATKQNVMPISKVRRGRQIDLDQVKRRSSGSSIIVTAPDDVTWETPPQVPQGAIAMSRELDLELDDLAGQQNYGSVETNNALGKTLGGLKLAAGAANAVAEFDVRVWIETWATTALSQIVRLEQYYEADPVVLGLCGQRAQLFEKHGIDRIDDDLLDQEVTVRVSVGLGAGDPAQRLQKFEMATNIIAPLAAQSQEFQSGQKEINIEAMIDEVYGAAGYKDGGARFFKDNGQPRQNPMADLKTQELQAKILRDQQMGKASMFTGIANLAKVALGKRELEADVVDTLLGHQQQARSMGFDHGHKHNQTHLAALDHGHRHGLSIADHRRQLANDTRNDQQQDQGAGGDAETSGAPPVPTGAPSGPQGQASASPPPPGDGTSAALMALLQNGTLDFTRGPDGRISGVRMAKPAGASQQFPTPG